MQPEDQFFIWESPHYIWIALAISSVVILCFSLIYLKLLRPKIPSITSVSEDLNWREQLYKGLSSSRDALRQAFSVFGGRRMDPEALESLREMFYRADLGVSLSDELLHEIKKSSIGSDGYDSLKIVKEHCLKILKQLPLSKVEISSSHVILMVGVNGVGKTTTCGKIAANFLATQRRVLLAAADVFRAAAVEQLETWGKRLNVEVVSIKNTKDAAAVAYTATQKMVRENYDVLIIDTAGRLHNKQDLMDELAKLRRVIGKELNGAPQEILLVVDASTGQNAIAQIRAFKEVTPLTGLVVTKLDGTARGGVALAAVREFGIPIRYLGVGETAADMKEFSAEEFVDALFG